MEMAIETWGLTKKYRSGIAVNNVYLRIPCGKAHGLLGPPGAGKTTFIKMLMGFKKPTSGGGFCLGYDLVTESNILREKVGYIAADTVPYKYLTINETFGFTRNFYADWDDNLVDKYLDIFGLSRRMPVKKLSADKRILLNLILALAPRPELLILDEPTESVIEPSVKIDFFSAVDNEVVANEKTVLLASRHLDDIKMLTGELSLIYRGKLLGNFTADDFDTKDLTADTEEICRRYLKGEKKKN